MWKMGMEGVWDLGLGSSGLRSPMKPPLAQVGMTEISPEKLMDIYEMIVFNRIPFLFKARNFLLLKLKLLNQTWYFTETVSLKSDVLCKSASICWLPMIPNVRGEIASVTYYLPKSANSKTSVFDCLCQSTHVLKGSILCPVHGSQGIYQISTTPGWYGWVSPRVFWDVSGSFWPGLSWDSWTF